MRRVVLFLVVVFSVVLCGCQAAGPKSVDDLIMVIDKVETLAESQGAAWAVDAEWTGDASVGEDVRLYLDTGLSVKVHVQGNAAVHREP